MIFYVNVGEKIRRKAQFVADAHNTNTPEVAAVTVRVSKEHTSTNLADLFTKTVVAPKREGILGKFTY